MKNFSKIKIKIFIKNLLVKEKIKKTIFMPANLGEVLHFKNLKFEIDDIRETKIKVNFYFDDNKKQIFILPSEKKKFFTASEITDYNFFYISNTTDQIFEISMEGKK